MKYLIYILTAFWGIDIILDVIFMPRTMETIEHLIIDLGLAVVTMFAALFILKRYEIKKGL